MTAIELALAKQRLQLQAAQQRDELASHAGGLLPLFDAADQVRAGTRWLKRHPEAVAGIFAVLVATRADARRFVWRWGRRGFLAWKLWRNSERWLHANKSSHPAS